MIITILFLASKFCVEFFFYLISILGNCLLLLYPFIYQFIKFSSFTIVPVIVTFIYQFIKFASFTIVPVIVTFIYQFIKFASFTIIPGIIIIIDYLIHYAILLWSWVSVWPWVSAFIMILLVGVLVFRLQFLKFCVRFIYFFFTGWRYFRY